MTESVRKYKIRKLQRRLDRLYRHDEEKLPKDQIEWITSNGEHVPVKKGSKKGVGPVSGKDFSQSESKPISELRDEEEETQRRDEEYMKAIESGDMETAQRMVDEEAEKAGVSLDRNGNPKPMYRGDKNDFNVFDRSKSKYSNLYGTGFYFTDSESHANQYGNAKKYYLDIQEPLTEGDNQHKITKKQMRKFLRAVWKNEDYGLDNYGYGSTVDSVLKQIWGKGDFEMLMDVNATCIGDMVVATELFNQLNGTKYDGIIVPTETVVFNSEQIKSANPVTKDDDGNVIPLSKRFNSQSKDIRY